MYKTADVLEKSKACQGAWVRTSQRPLYLSVFKTAMYVILVALKLNLQGRPRALLPLMNGSIRYAPEVGLQSDKIKLGAAKVHKALMVRF